MVQNGWTQTKFRDYWKFSKFCRFFPRFSKCWRFLEKIFLRVVDQVFSFNIAYCDISALEHAYSLKICHDRYHSKALDLIYWKKSQKFEKSTLKFFWDSAKLFPKIIIISELSLSPAPANFDSSKEPLTNTTNGWSGTVIQWIPEMRRWMEKWNYLKSRNETFLTLLQ